MTIKLKHCPSCNKSGRDMFIHRIMYKGSIFDGYLYLIECPSCHHCGKAKLSEWMAKLSWNKEKR